MSQLLTKEGGKVSSISVYKGVGTETCRKCVIAYIVPVKEALSKRAVDGTKWEPGETTESQTQKSKGREIRSGK